MNAERLALMWLDGDLQFRPREVSREHVLRVALADPVRAAEIVCHLNDGRRSLTCGPAFAMNLREYRANAERWRLHERTKNDTQRRIDACERNRPRSYLP